MAKGGKRVGAGRPKGSQNKVKLAARVVAARHAEAIITELARLALHAEFEGVRVTAGKEILDRAYGKPMQPFEADMNVSVVERQIETVFNRTDGKRLGQSVRRGNGAAGGPRVASGQPLQDH